MNLRFLLPKILREIRRLTVDSLVKSRREARHRREERGWILPVIQWTWPIYLTLDPDTSRVLEIQRSRSQSDSWDVVSPPKRRLTHRGPARRSRRPLLLSTSKEYLALVAAGIYLREKGGGEIRILDDTGEVIDRIWIARRKRDACRQAALCNR